MVFANRSSENSRSDAFAAASHLGRDVRREAGFKLARGEDDRGVVLLLLRVLQEPLVQTRRGPGRWRWRACRTARPSRPAFREPSAPARRRHSAVRPCRAWLRGTTSVPRPARTARWRGPRAKRANRFMVGYLARWIAIHHQSSIRTGPFAIPITFRSARPCGRAPHRTRSAAGPASPQWRTERAAQSKERHQRVGRFVGSRACAISTVTTQ